MGGGHRQVPGIDTNVFGRRPDRLVVCGDEVLVNDPKRLHSCESEEPFPVLLAGVDPFAETLDSLEVVGRNVADGVVAQVDLLLSGGGKPVRYGLFLLVSSGDKDVRGLGGYALQHCNGSAPWDTLVD